jgi:hypothetical protein
MLDLLTDLFISAYMPPCQTSTPFDPTYSPASLPVASNRAEGTPDPFHPLEDDFDFSNLPDPATLDLPSFTIPDVPSDAAATTSSAALQTRNFLQAGTPSSGSGSPFSCASPWEDSGSGSEAECCSGEFSCRPRMGIYERGLIS